MNTLTALPLAEIVVGTGGSLLGLLILIADIIAIVTLLQSKSSPLHKILWILLIVALPVIGLVLYYLLGQTPIDAS